MKYFVRPEKRHKDIIGPTFGPFEDFIQITYGSLRSGPRGEPIGYCANGLWFFNPHVQPKGFPCNYKSLHNCPKNCADIGFTDVVIWAK